MREVQIKYVVLTVFLLTSYTLLLLAAIFAPYVIALSADIPMAEQAAAAEVILILHSNIWPWIGLLILLCGVYSIFITHKMAGPLFIINRMAGDVAGGNLTARIKLRKGDDLSSFADSFNVMIDSMEGLLITLSKSHKETSKDILSLENKIKEGQVSDQVLKEFITKVNMDNKENADILGRYQLRDEVDS